MSTPVVLSIGTTHPWNIAGVGLDAQVAAEYGLRSATVITGIAAQDEDGIRDRFAVPLTMLRAQLACVPRAQIKAIRVGAIFDAENVREVALYLRDNRAGAHRELWYHGSGCRCWLVVSRDTRDHAITAVVFARDAARARDAERAAP